MGFINEYHWRHYEACIKEFAGYTKEQLSPENLMRNALRIRRESQKKAPRHHSIVCREATRNWPPEC